MKNTITAILLAAATLFCASCQKESSDTDIPTPVGSIEVRGSLIDIRTVAAGEKIFPQHENFRFTQQAVELFEPGMHYATSLMQSRGPEAFRCGSEGTVYLASDCAELKAEGWKATGESFSSGERTYYLHSMSCPANQWIDVPNPADRKYTTLLFAPKMLVAGESIQGTIIARVPELRANVISNACMTILPDGSYLAACTGATGPGAKGATLFISADKGASWQTLQSDLLDKNGIANYFNLFQHKGALYMMGTGVGGRDMLISRSEDLGKNWTYPTDEHSGLLRSGMFHSSSVPAVVCGGRLWRAFETNAATKDPFVMSAPEESDLLEATNWTQSATIAHDPNWAFNSKSVSELIEGNIVATPAGKLYNILRGSSSSTSSAAAKVSIVNAQELRFAGSSDFINLPGGGKKFTIRYDARSNAYWAITTPASGTYAGMKHNGIYAQGISHDLVRNRMVLCYSKDLTTWVQYKQVAFNEDPFFHGFQYADWCFDGEDIVAVVRTATPESRGLPVRQHDANMLVFHRIPNFRQL